MIKLSKGWIEEKIGSKKFLKKTYKYKQTDSMDMINFAGDISELPSYKTNVDFNFGDQKGIALVQFISLLQPLGGVKSLLIIMGFDLISQTPKIFAFPGINLTAPIK